MLAEKGIVYLVGAGPGDPGLITLKGMELLSSASVVVYDYLVDERLLESCQPGCERVYAGKKAGNHSMSQDQINQLLVSKAREGHSVVRLKGGDPHVFGRGGEEALYLFEQEVAFEVVPGITSGIAAPAYAGIPVTFRGMATSLCFITGHESGDATEDSIDWEALARLKGTLVFYMGVRNLPLITVKLIDHGKAPTTPVALVRYGTWAQQETLFGTLDTIHAMVERSGFTPPALVIVGEVVSLHEKLDWFTRKPLHGKRLLVTRSRQQSSSLNKLLISQGAEVVELPTIAIRPIEDNHTLQEVIRSIQEYSWIIFTSVNSVSVFFDELHRLGKDTRVLGTCRVAAIGSTTAGELSKHGIETDLVPEKYTSDDIGQAFCMLGQPMNVEKVLVPGSALSTDTIQNALRDLGYQVEKVVAYENTLPVYTRDELSGIFERPFDMVCFTSSSAVHNFCALLREHNIEEVVKNTVVATIGPITSQAAQEEGFTQVVESDVHTLDGLVKIVISYFKPLNP